MNHSSSLQSVTSSQSDSAASSSTLRQPIFGMRSPSSLVWPLTTLRTGQSTVEKHAITTMRQERRVDAAFFAGQPLKERRMESLARIDIVLDDLQRAFAGQSDGRYSQEEP
ncbi:hypothetical protein CLAIMM_12856 isoform 3 [Cladophialophora immunda]|nr:hypothetical protein CLAIMM_12856 isoform 1 [Cladophialophora immunda]OQV08612.1 hypothetical protein CLAIMM_12856 isoform 2 [Cladophialophora immunda]OQV08613.1 hypothetical protein CLAIMM_12856 isoform 3 [Cladophialophora immunda]